VHQPPAKRLLDISRFTGDAFLVSLSARVPVRLDVTDTHLLITSEDSSDAIPLSAITRVLTLSVAAAAVLTGRIQRVLDFAPTSCHPFVASLQRPPCDLLGEWRERWLARDATTFDYLCVVNLVSGRPFNGDLSSHPLFPALDADWAELNDFSLPALDGRFASYDEAHSLFAPPELYFLPQFVKDFDIVYANRCALEAREDVHVWLTRVFGTPRDNALSRPVFADPHPPRAPLAHAEQGAWQADISMESERPLARCFAVAPGGALLACVYADGVLAFGGISPGDADPRFEPRGAVWAVAGRAQQSPWGVLVYRRGSLTLFTGDAKVEAKRIFLSKFEIFGDVCLVSDTELRRLKFDGEALSLEPFAVLPAAVLCFASAPDFGITAAGCADGKLRIRANEDGRKVATIELGELATTVLITPSWGLVVVKTAARVWVFDPNGFPVRKVERGGEFVLAMVFSTREGRDFVAFQDSENKVFSFEAMKPAVMTHRESGGSRLVCIDYDWRSARFLFVACTGKVLVLSA
jgi:hypothetical protein